MRMVVSSLSILMEQPWMLRSQLSPFSPVAPLVSLQTDQSELSTWVPREASFLCLGLWCSLRMNSSRRKITRTFKKLYSTGCWLTMKLNLKRTSKRMLRFLNTHMCQTSLPSQTDWDLAYKNRKSFQETSPTSLTRSYTSLILIWSQNHLSSSLSWIASMNLLL